MKIVNSYIFRAVCALLIGLLLVSNPERMTGLLVQVIGGLFLISGLVSLINYFIIRYSDKVPVKPVFPMVGLGSLLFGVFLGFFPGLFITYLMYIFGFLMVVAGVNQLWNMFRLRRLIPFRWYVLFFTLLITALGVFVLFNPLESASVPFILLGVSFMLYGVSELITMSMQALLNDGDEVLVPMPDYPLWTAAVTLAGGKAVHYLCDEEI